MMEVPEAKIYPKMWNSLVMRKYARLIVLSFLNPLICATENCQLKSKIEIHHVNGNPYDNRIKNLMPLCSSCHHRIDKRIRNIPNYKNKKNGGKAYKKFIVKYESKRNKITGRFMNWKPSSNVNRHDGIPHPKGMLGKHHSPASKKRISLGFRRYWNIKNKR